MFLVGYTFQITVLLETFCEFEVVSQGIGTFNTFYNIAKPRLVDPRSSPVMDSPLGSG